MGTASNPGPAVETFTLWVANVTTVVHVPMLAQALPAPGFIAAQETRGGPHALATAEAALRPSRAHLASRLCGLELVASVVKDCACKSFPIGEVEAWAGPRIEPVAAQFGISVLHVINIYAPCQSQVGGPSAATACERLVHRALGIAAELGQVPCVIVGDFNQDPLPALAAAECALSGWRDLGSQLGPTTSPGAGRAGRRIDRILANSQAAQALQAVRLRWDLGIATHAVLEATFRVEGRPAYWCRLRPDTLAGLPHAHWVAATAATQASRRWAAEEPVFRRDLEAGRLDEAWDALSASAHAFLADRSGVTTAQRGSPGAVLRHQVPAPVNGHGYAETAMAHRQAAVRRACRAALAAWPEGAAMPAAAVKHWRAAQQATLVAERNDWAELLATADSGRLNLEQAFAAISADYAALGVARRKFRRDQWHEFVTCDVARGGRRVFRWVKQPSLQEPAPLVHTPDGLSGGPAAELAMAGPAWQALWAQRDESPPAEANLRAAVRGLPAFPQPPAILPPATAAGIWALPLGTAPGPDGWTAEELRLWGPHHIAALTALFAAVERLGRWPSGLAAADVVLLPKPGGPPDQALQRRPITLLPVIYRLWARLRLSAVDHWRAQWDPAAGDAPKGPDGQAWDLSWDLACAEAGGQVVAGVAIDMTKCYDSVRLPMLRRMLATAGWPSCIHGPLLAAYGARRRVRVGDAVGPFHVPVAGIPAGCPIAVAALGVVTWPWQLAALQAGATTARRYVDDLTAWTRGDGEDCRVATAALWSASALFAAAAQLTISQAKSGAFASCPLVRAEIAADDPSMAILTTFKDLGILQHAGKASAAATAARAQSTFGRFERLAGLPLPLPRRVQAVAAAGVAAAAYGAIAGTPPARTLARLRTWAGRAVWRGGRFGAVELRLLLGAEHGRADPAAVFALAPLLAFSKALRRGWATVPDARLLADCAGRQPLTSALKRSMRSLGLSGSLLLWEAHELVGHAGGVWDPATAGLDATADWLRARWRAVAAAAVAKRRPAFAATAAGIDWPGAARALAHLSASPTAWAAARSAMVGDSVTATRASHWRDVSRCCPHCDAEEETVEHPLWCCPRWDAARQRAAAKAGLDWREVAACASPLTRHSLLRAPMPPPGGRGRPGGPAGRTLPSPCVACSQTGAPDSLD